MKTAKFHKLGRVSIAMLLLAGVLSCNGKQPDPYPQTGFDGVEATYEDDLPDDAQLIHEMWSLLRADAYTTDPTVILADILADEAYAHALAGAQDDALLFWRRRFVSSNTLDPIRPV